MNTEQTSEVVVIKSGSYIISYKLKLTKMRVELANLNDCAVPFLSRAAVNLFWYYCLLYI